jgi:hypothetical protein
MQASAAITFYDSRARMTERRAKLDRRLAGIAREFAVHWELNKVDSALTQLPSGSKTYWGLSDRVPAPDGAIGVQRVLQKSLQIREMRP